MAELGDKVGDAYIEVHAELDKKSLAKANSELKVSTLKAEKDINDRLVRNSREAYEKAHINAIRIERQRIQEMGRLQVQALNEDRRRTIIASKERIKIEQKMHRDIDVVRKKRFKDGGVPGVGESVENLVSILPGQLEKLGRNPYIAGAALGVGLAIGDAIILGAAGTLAGATASAGIIAPLVYLIKNDQEVAAAAAQLGDRALAALGKQALKFKSVFIGAFATLGTALEKGLGQLNFDILVPQVTRLSKAFGDFFVKIGPGLNDLFGVGAGVLQDFATFALPALAKSFNYLGSVIKDNEVEIRAAMKMIEAAIVATVYVIGALVDGGAAAFDTLKDTIVLGMQALIAPIKIYNAIVTKIPKLGDKIDIPTGAIDELITKVDNFGQVLPPVDKAATGTGLALNGVADAAAGAIPPAATLAEQMERQKQAFDDAYAAQRNYDQGIATGLGHQQAYTLAQDEIKRSLKENGKTLDQNTVKGVNNAKTLESNIRGLKDAYLKDLEAGKITRDAAIKGYGDQAKALLSKFDKGSPAYKAIQDLINKLGDFPDVAITATTDFSAALANIANLKSALAGVQGAGAKIRAQNVLDKNTGNGDGRASGGSVSGPGTSTSDSIPMNLSNGEFVIKASSAKRIGLANLNAMNSSGRIPGHMAKGGSVGRGSTASQVALYNSLVKQVSILTGTVNQLSDSLKAYSEQASASAEQFKSFVNLGQLQTEGKSTGDVLQELLDRKSKAGAFQRNLVGLKKRGLSQAALQQVAEAGPDSDIAKLLLGATAFDVGLINQTLGGAGAYGRGIAGTVFPGGGSFKARLKQNQALLAKRRKQAAKLKPVVAKGATISYAGGRTTALFSKAELQNQQLHAGTYVTVMIDGKEVRAIVKQEAAKTTKKTNRNIKSGRK